MAHPGICIDCGNRKHQRNLKKTVVINGAWISMKHSNVCQSNEFGFLKCDLDISVQTKACTSPQWFNTHI